MALLARSGVDKLYQSQIMLRQKEESQAKMSKVVQFSDERKFSSLDCGTSSPSEFFSKVSRLQQKTTNSKNSVNFKGFRKHRRDMFNAKIATEEENMLDTNFSSSSNVNHKNFNHPLETTHSDYDSSSTSSVHMSNLSNTPNFSPPNFSPPNYSPPNFSLGEHPNNASLGNDLVDLQVVISPRRRSLSPSLPLPRPKIVWFAKSVEEEKEILDLAMNGALVGFAGAVALTKVLTVDQDYWRGWTVFEILRSLPRDNWHAYEAMLSTNPVLAKMTISGIVYTLGDWSAQCYEGRPFLRFDRMRMIRSGLVGFCLHGSLSHHYYHFCEWLFPSQEPWVVPAKILFDQTIWSGVWNSIYYTALGLLRFEKPSTIWKELRATFFPLLTAGWKLWPFAHLVTYGVVPVEQRVLWVDSVELIWVAILSIISNEKAEERREVNEELGIEKSVATIGETNKKDKIVS